MKHRSLEQLSDKILEIRWDSYCKVCANKGCIECEECDFDNGKEEPDMYMDYSTFRFLCELEATANDPNG